MKGEELGTASYVGPCNYASNLSKYLNQLDAQNFVSQ